MIKVTRYKPNEQLYSYYINPDLITGIYPKRHGATITVGCGLDCESLEVTDKADVIARMCINYKAAVARGDFAH